MERQDLRFEDDVVGNDRSASDTERPVKWVPERPNVWRIVYAD